MWKNSKQTLYKPRDKVSRKVKSVRALLANEIWSQSTFFRKVQFRRLRRGPDVVKLLWLLLISLLDKSFWTFLIKLHFFSNSSINDARLVINNLKRLSKKILKDMNKPYSDPTTQGLII
jgi:hypothetical protein